MIKVKGDPIASSVRLDAEITALRKELARLHKRNVTLEAIVAQYAKSNATRQKAYRERKKANG
jgi:cell division protein FtsB